MGLMDLRVETVRTRTSTAGNDGFTLLELIVVLVIIGLSAAVVLFSIGRLHETTLFSQEARRVYQTLGRARTIALLEKKEVVVRVNEEGHSYGIEGDNSPSARNPALRRGTELSGKDIVFYPKGHSSGGVITLRNAKGQGYVIEVNQVLGKPSIRRL
ncbi:MAG: type II secretion system protein GspH [Thermodesulfovibrio sp.]|nr:type II secretion system protein GspH [Thermodesulfovibrio sp.]